MTLPVTEFVFIPWFWAWNEHLTWRSLYIHNIYWALHYENRWLSQYTVFSWVGELVHEMTLFFSNSNSSIFFANFHKSGNVVYLRIFLRIKSFLAENRIILIFRILNDQMSISCPCEIGNNFYFPSTFRTQLNLTENKIYPDYLISLSLTDKWGFCTVIERLTVRMSCMKWHPNHFTWISFRQFLSLF